MSDENKRLSPLGAEMVARLSEFCDASESGGPIEKRFTVRIVKPDAMTDARANEENGGLEFAQRT